MEVVAIGSDRDVKLDTNTVNYLTLDSSAKFLQGMFEVKEMNGNKIYKCIFNEFVNSHKITDEKDNTIAKYKIKLEIGILTVTLTPKLNGKDGDELSFTIAPKEINDNQSILIVNFYNKATKQKDTMEIVNRSRLSFDNNFRSIFDYTFYHGDNEKAPFLCKMYQERETETKISIDIQPNVEPLFMVILFVVLYQRKLKLNRFNILPNKTKY